MSAGNLPHRAHRGSSSRARAAQRSVELGPSVSSALGEAWAHDVANALRAQTRDVVGGWPGTIREARSRVLLGIHAARRPRVDAVELEAMSRAVYDAARRCWDQISGPDPEP
jgi:hypothetical protein